MKELYHYLKTRAVKPLKNMQALVVISKKLLTLIYTPAKKKQYYHEGLVDTETWLAVPDKKPATGGYRTTAAHGTRGWLGWLSAVIVTMR